MARWMITCVLVSGCWQKKRWTCGRFFPLTVNYQEKLTQPVKSRVVSLNVEGRPSEFWNPYFAVWMTVPIRPIYFPNGFMNRSTNCCLLCCLPTQRSLLNIISLIWYICCPCYFRLFAFQWVLIGCSRVLVITDGHISQYLVLSDYQLVSLEFSWARYAEMQY